LPCVRGIIELLGNEQTSNIIQDVPVRVVSPAQIDELAEPCLPPCSGVVLSPFQKIALLIEKFRHVSQPIQLTVDSSNSIELHFKVCTPFFIVVLRSQVL